MTRGAGGTPGGSLSFFVGLSMACAGLYLLLGSISVHSGFGLGMVLWNVGGRFGLTSGALLIPFLAGVGVIFYNSKNPLGWILSVGSLTAIILGVIMSLQLSIRSMSLLEMLIILVLLAGGLGIFAKSLATPNASR